MTGGELLAAAVVDALLGDPHWLPHPVRVMGRCIAWCDHGVRRICRSAINLRLAGICLAIGLPTVTFVLATVIIEEAKQVAEWLGSALSIIMA